MDPKSFLDKLTELAEIQAVHSQLISPPRKIKIREEKNCDRDHNFEADAEDAEDADCDSNDSNDADTDHIENPTLNIKIKRLKSQPRSCEDCGDMVIDRVVERKIYSFPERHWRERCQACRRTRNPETGQFELKGSGAAIQNFFTSRLNKKNSDFLE